VGGHGAIAAGTGGAIFGSVIPAAHRGRRPASSPAPGPGATAGYAAAETGLILLASFLAAEQISTVKPLRICCSSRRRGRENEDLNQASDSIIAMVTASALILIAWMAVSLAKLVFAFIKGVFVRFRGKAVEPEVAAAGAAFGNKATRRPRRGRRKKVLAEEPTADDNIRSKLRKMAPAFIARTAPD
jgi:hypothetical protein